MKKTLIVAVLVLFLLPVIAQADGKGDYNTKCAACHAPKAKVQKISDLEVSKMTRDEMIAVTQKGKGIMPGYEKDLSQAQIEAVIDYVLTLKEKDK